MMETPGSFTRRQFLWRASAAAMPSRRSRRSWRRAGLTNRRGRAAPTRSTWIVEPAAAPDLRRQPPNRAGCPEAGPLRMITFADYVPAKLPRTSSVSSASRSRASRSAPPTKGCGGRERRDQVRPLQRADREPASGGPGQADPSGESRLHPEPVEHLAFAAGPLVRPGSVYTIGSVVGAFGIGRRTDIVDIDVANLDNPWDAMWDPRSRAWSGSTTSSARRSRLPVPQRGEGHQHTVGRRVEGPSRA